MAQIALNKPSGGQMILAPEDGTSSETITISSAGVGKIINTWSAFNNNRVAYGGNNNQWYSISDLSLTLTPSRADSQLLVQVMLNYAGGTESTNAHSVYVRMLRDGVVDKRLNGNGFDADGTGGDQTQGYSCMAQYRCSGGSDDFYHMEHATVSALIPTNSTNTTTFGFQWRVQGSGSFKLNADSSWPVQQRGSHQPQGISYIIVSEVAA